MPDFASSQFWIAVLHIVAINIVLSGDNAIVIALACRSLPPRQRRVGVIFGAMGAIVLRVILTFVAIKILEYPYLKIVGAILLLWIGVSLLKPAATTGHGLKHQPGIAKAVQTIIIADVVMSLDNVLGVAAAAKGDIFLLVLGLVLSVPLIVWGSAFVLALMDRFPFTITLGAGLLGWVAGNTAIDDSAFGDWIPDNFPWIEWLVPAAGALLVMTIGLFLKRRAGPNTEIVDLVQRQPSNKN